MQYFGPKRLATSRQTTNNYVRYGRQCSRKEDSQIGSSLGFYQRVCNVKHNDSIDSQAKINSVCLRNGFQINRQQMQVPAAAASSTIPFSSQPVPGPDSTIEERLDYIPSLSSNEQTISLLLTAAAVVALYSKFFASWGVIGLVTCGLLGIALYTIIKTMILERYYKQLQVPYDNLPTPYSSWELVNDLNVHVTTHNPSSPQTQHRHIHCLHGFGSNEWSWCRAAPALADRCRAKVTSHDTAGFGRTERKRSLSYYTINFDAKVALHLTGVTATKQTPASTPATPASADSPTPPSSQSPIEQARRLWQGTASQPAVTAPSTSPPSASSLYTSPRSTPSSTGSSLYSQPPSAAQTEAATQYQSGVIPRGPPTPAAEVPQAPQATPGQTRVLMGHSMGAVTAATAYLRNPSAYEAVIMVAPALVGGSVLNPPPSMVESNKIRVAGVQCVQAGQQAAEGEDAGAEKRTGQATGGGQKMKGNVLGRQITTMLIKLGSVLPLVFWLLRPLLIQPLRALVHNKSTWVNGLNYAYVNPSKVTKEVINAYRLPQLFRDWELGFLNFGAARQKPRTRPGGLTDEFVKAVRRHGTRVLIIHGDGDRVVPVANSRRLLGKLSGTESTLLQFQACGHNVQEELTEKFVQAIVEWLGP